MCERTRGVILADPDGRFALRTAFDDSDGAVVGEHFVLITTATEDAVLGDAGVMIGEKAPEHYRDGSVRFNVPRGGTDDAEFELSHR